jgi:HEAT repeat protein
MERKLSGGTGFRSAKIKFAVSCILLLLASSAAFSQTVQEKPWEILQAGLNERSTSKRAAAVKALGLLQDNGPAIESAEKALGDKKTAVRAAAATALGQMGAQSSTSLLKEATADKETRVACAASDSLILLGDPAGYDAYYEILTGERKSGQGLIAEKKKLITDPRAMVLLGVGVGIGFAPYAGYGWMVWQELSKDYKTPVRINALTKLANDPDSRINEGLVKAASDKHWSVRVAALSAIAHHGDPRLICRIRPHITDKNAAVRYTAAAAVIRLSALVSADDTKMATRQ